MKKGRGRLARNRMAALHLLVQKARYIAIDRKTDDGIIVTPRLLVRHYTRAKRIECWPQTRTIRKDRLPTALCECPDDSISWGSVVWSIRNLERLHEGATDKGV